MALDYWYDGQLRRYWIQFCRIFENFQYQEGIGENGAVSFRTFPIKLASKDKQIGHILRNNSENTMMSCPRLSASMTNLEMSDERRQNPTHVSTVNIVERAVNPVTGAYTGERGNTYSVERYMGVPYDMEMQLDVWTSNESQKHQFMEQVMMLFNPGLDIQSSTNVVDWGALTTVTMKSLNWSSRTFNITDDDVEISTLTFNMPIWIMPPAKIKRQNIIHQIITNIATIPKDSDMRSGDGVDFSQSDYHTRIIVSPENHLISVAGNTITLLDEYGLADPSLKWRDLLNRYGTFRPGISQIRLKTTADMDDHDSDIIGSYDMHPTDANKIRWTIDTETLPANTLNPINAMINTQSNIPGRDGFPAAVNGQRYLLAEDLVVSSADYLDENGKLQPGSIGDNGWNNLRAKANDIIEYVNGVWVKAFDSELVTDTQYVLNSAQSKQLKWTGSMWVMAIDGDYRPGFWRIFL